MVQDYARPEEIGRATAAHQFARNMAVTYGTALAGAVMLLVVHQILGSSEAVQDLLTNAESKTVTALQPTERPDLALAKGFLMAHLVGLALATGALVSAVLGQRAGTP